MSLFERKRSVVALGQEALDSIKSELDSLLRIAASYDQLISKGNGMVISLEGRIRGDLVAFTLYLAGVTKGVDPREIAVVNRIFDIDLSHVDFLIFRKDVANKWYETAVPPSILILNEMGSVLQQEQTTAEDGRTASQVAEESGVTNIAQAFSDDLINMYALIGSAFISADEKVTKRESEDLIRYLYMLARSVYGEDAKLPAGPAQRTEWAHERLFGKKPKTQ